MMEEFTGVQPEQSLEQPAPMPQEFPEAPPPAEPAQEEAPVPEERPPEEACQAPGGPGEMETGEAAERAEAAEAAPLPESDPRLEELLAAVKESGARLEELRELFERRVAHTDMEEKVIDRMHAELQRYKEDMYAQLVRPILLDIIEVRDSIQRMAANYLARPEGEQSIPNKTFAGYAYDLQDILEKNQVEVYRSQPGDSFTPLRQRVIKKIQTGDESLHGTLAESLSSGYAYGGRVLSPEKIAVYLYEKPAGSPADEEDSKATSENAASEPENREKSEKSEENDNG